MPPSAIGVPVVLTHGIGDLDTKKARAEILAICKIANIGYSIGDVITLPTGGYSSAYSTCLEAVLTTTEISTIITSTNTLYIRNKSTSAIATVDFSRWMEVVFRIWY